MHGTNTHHIQSPLFKLPATDVLLQVGNIGVDSTATPGVAARLARTNIAGTIAFGTSIHNVSLGSVEMGGLARRIGATQSMGDGCSAAPLVGLELMVWRASYSSQAYAEGWSLG